MKNNRKAVEERQIRILELVKEKGEARVEEIAEQFGISMMTVRRDLQLLEEQELLSRIHGGAISIERAHTMRSIGEEIRRSRERISEYAARLIDDGDSLFINGSRTALNMLKYLKNKKVNVVTNNGWAIGETYPAGVTVRLTGGEMRGHIMIGEYVMRNLLGMSADKTVIGCAAVYDDGEFRYDIPTEIGINEVMISRTSKELYVLADHTKIQRRGSRANSYGSCIYDRSCTLVTDAKADEEVLDRLRRYGINVIIVPES